MQFELDGLGNPGWTFTNERMQQLEAMFNWISEKEENSLFEYKQLQQELTISVNVLNESKVRMFFPWLEYYGVLSDYTRIKTFGELYTSLGKGFVTFTPVYNRLIEKQKNGDLSEEENQVLEATFNDFIFEFYKNIVCNERGILYTTVIEAIKKLEFISFDEFFALTHSIKHEFGIEWAYETIQKMRTSDNVEVTILSNKNVYGYTTPFLEQAGIVKIVDKKIYPNKTKKFNEV